MVKEQLSRSEIKSVCDILRRDDGVGAGDYVEQLSWPLFLKVFEGVEAQLKELAEADGKKYQDIIDKDYKWSSWAKKDWKDKDELIHFVNMKLFPYLRGLKGSKEKEKVAEIFRELSGNKIRSGNTIADVIDILDQIDMAHFQDTHLLSQVYEDILQEMGSEGGWSGEFYTPRPIIRLMIKIINPKIGEAILDPFVGSGGFLVESFDYMQKNNPRLGVKEWNTLQNKTFYGQEKKPLPYLVGTMNMILHRILVPNIVRANSFMDDVHSVAESSKVDVILTNPPFGAEENESVQNNFPVQIAATEGLALQYVMRRLKNGGRCGIIMPEGQILFGGGSFQKIREELLEKFNILAVISLPQGAFAQMGAGVKTNLVFFEKTGSTKEVWYGEVSGKFTKIRTIGDIDFEDVYAKYTKKELSDSSWIVPISEIKKRRYSLLPRNPYKATREELKEPIEIIAALQNINKESIKVLTDLFESCSGKNSKKELRLLKLNVIADMFIDGDWIEKKNQSKSGIILIQTGNVGIIDYRNKIEKRYISEDTFKLLQCTEVFPGDILISRLPDPVGRACIVPKLGARLITAVDCTIFRPKKGYSVRYINYLLNSTYALDQVYSFLTGSSRKRISRKNLENIELPIPFANDNPDFQEQERIANKLDEIRKRIGEVEKKYQESIENLEKTKKSILNQAFQGKL